MNNVDEVGLVQKVEPNTRSTLINGAWSTSISDHIYVTNEVVKLREGLIHHIKFFPLLNPFQAYSPKKCFDNATRVKVLFILLQKIFRNE